MATKERSGIAFLDRETCYIVGCPEPRIDHEFYSDYQAIDPRHDGFLMQALSRRILDPITGDSPVAFRHWWHSVGSGYTGEQSEYILNPSVSKSMCDYELSKVGIDDDGRTYSYVSRLETFTLMLAELHHYNLI